ncbi:hypothetical protein MRX96_020518 [Rhipicephalus microplus]
MSRQCCKWSCPHCTYENWPKAQRCVICQNPRPTLIEEEASSEERDIYKMSPLLSPRSGRLVPKMVMQSVHVSQLATVKQILTAVLTYAASGLAMPAPMRTGQSHESVSCVMWLV